MININEVWNFIQRMAKKDQKGLLTPDEFNTLAPVAQQRVVNRYLPAWPNDANVENVLRPLVTSATLTPVVSSGLATITLPADYMKLDVITTSANRGVQVVPNYKFVQMIKSFLKAPTVDFPLGTLYGNVMEVKPTNVGNLSFRYLRQPEAPHWDYTIVNGQPVYNATSMPGVTGKVSKHFELPVEVHEEIAIHILHDAGVILEDGLLIQYGLKAAGE